MKQNTNQNQNQNQKKPPVDSGHRRRALYFVNLIFMSCVTILSLLFAIFALVSMRGKGDESFGKVYTGQQVRTISESAAREEKEKLLGQIRTSLEAGKGTTQVFREIFENNIIVVSGERYLFFPLVKGIERNPLVPGLLSYSDGIVEYKGAEPSVGIRHGVLLTGRNGRIDWDRLSDSGIEEVTVCAGSVSESGFEADQQYERNCRKAAEKNLPWALCLEADGPAGTDTLTEAVDALFESEAVRNRVEGLTGAEEESGGEGETGGEEENDGAQDAEGGSDPAEEEAGQEDAQQKIPVLLRIRTKEIMSENGKEQQLWTKTVRNLCELLEERGLQPVIGASLYTFAAQIDLASVSQYERWVIDHAESSEFPYTFRFWEYTSEGSSEGVPGSSIFYVRLRISSP